MKKLDIGPGRQSLGPDWLSIGARCPELNGQPAYHLHTFWRLEMEGRHLPPDFKDEFDLIYASHVLEHLPWYRTVDVLRRWLRALKPGGVLEVWVPDLDVILEALAADRIPAGDNYRKHNPTGDVWRWLNGRLYADDDERVVDRHFAVFDHASLTDLLREAGFERKVEVITDPPRGHDDHGPINLGLRARRPL